MAKLTAFGKQIRVLESFHSSPNLSKKLKLQSFMGRREYTLSFQILCHFSILIDE
jgi:hypothetical protein